MPKMPDIIVVTQDGEEVSLSETFVRQSPVLMNMVEGCMSQAENKSIPMPAFGRESVLLVESTVKSMSAEPLEDDVHVDDTVLLQALKLTDFLGMEDERKHLIRIAGKRLAKISSDACKGVAPLSTAMRTINVFFPLPAVE